MDLHKRHVLVPVYTSSHNLIVILFANKHSMFRPSQISRNAQSGKIGILCIFFIRNTRLTSTIAEKSWNLCCPCETIQTHKCVY